MNINNVIRYFEENPAVAEEIDKELRKRLLTKAKPEAAEAEAMPEELLDA